MAGGYATQALASNSNVLSWSTRGHGLSPNPARFREPIIQVYEARTRGAKSALAVHTWIAYKDAEADEYTVAEIIGWRLRRTGTALVVSKGVPDKAWYGNEPSLILDLRGAEYSKVIDKLEKAINSYPYKDEYTAWPGPNSNTFVAWLGLEVPELGLDLPSTAIGKDWRPIEDTFGLSPSGTGVQASLFGLLGLTLGYEEGLEINILGLNFELDLFDLALELPGIGRIGLSEVGDIDNSTPEASVSSQ